MVLKMFGLVVRFFEFLFSGLFWLVQSVPLSTQCDRVITMLTVPAGSGDIILCLV